MKFMRKKSVHFLSATPAALALVAGVFLGFRPHPSSPHDLDWCRTAAVAAEDNSDQKTASVCYARLLQAQPHDREIAFKLAESLQATGQPESAKGLMVRLASSDNREYPPADIWLARQVLTEQTPSAAALELAARRLSKAIQLSPDDPEANYWLAVAQARSNHWDAVEQPAGKVVDRLSELSQRLSAIAAEQGNTAAAKRWNEVR